MQIERVPRATLWVLDQEGAAFLGLNFAGSWRVSSSYNRYRGRRWQFCKRSSFEIAGEK